MKSLMIILLSLVLCSGVFAQKQNVWKGGKPGRATDWSCAANWSTYRVPDEFSDVVIPRMESRDMYPVIRSGEYQVNSLRIQCAARVTIARNGSLFIHDTDYCEDVSRIEVIGKLIIPGRVIGEQEVVLTQH